MATTDTALQNDPSVKIGLVLAIEGYEHLIVSHDAAGAAAAWVATDWTSALPGLSVDGEISQSFSPWRNSLEASILEFVLSGPTADTVGQAMSRRGSGLSTQLIDELTEGDSFCNVKDHSSFPASGTIHIGPERMTYTSKLNVNGKDRFSGLTRGLYAPFKALTETNQRFARVHRITTDDIGTTSKPIVSDEPQSWEGRWCGLWVHRIVGGVWDTRAEARLDFAGKLVGPIEDRADLTFVISAQDFRGVLSEAIVHRDPYRARFQEVFYLYDGLFFQASEIYGTSNSNIGDPLQVVTGASSLPTEVEPGFYTLVELLSILNRWFSYQGPAQLGNLDGYWSAGLARNDSGEWRFSLQAGFLGSAVAGRIYTCAFAASSYAFFNILGMASNVKGGSDPNGGRTDGVAFGTNEATAAGVPVVAEVVGEKPPKRIDIPSALDFFNDPRDEHFIKVERLRGEWINNHDVAPEPLRTENQNLADWGFIQAAGAIIPVERIDDETFRIIHGTSGVKSIFAKDPAKIIGLRGTTADRSDLETTQVLIIQQSLSVLLKLFLSSTDGEQYNSPTNDLLPGALGLGIPGELLQAEFENSVDALVQSTNVLGTVMVIDRPTSFQDLIFPELVLRLATFVFEENEIQISSISSTLTALAQHTLNVSNKAAPSNTQDKLLSPLRWDDSFFVNVVRVEHDRDLSNVYHDVTEIRNQRSIESEGESQPLTIKARNTYAGVEATSDVILELGKEIARTILPVFGRPLPLIDWPMPHTLFHAVPGDGVNVTDAFARDPDTGLRGITARQGVIISARHNWPQEREQATGVLTILLFDRSRIARYSPSGRIDSTANSGGFTAGYNSSVPSIRLRASEFTSGIVTERDAGSFDDPDEILIIEKDPADPDDPLFWERTIISVSTDDIELNATLASPTFDSAKEYLVISQRYSQATSEQKADAYAADSEDGLIEDAAEPYQYGILRTFKFSRPLPIDSRPERHANLLYEDGFPLNPGVDTQLARMADQLADEKTAFHGPQLFQGAAFNFLPYTLTTTVEIGEDRGYGLIMARPIFIGRGDWGINRSGTYRPLIVQPIFGMIAGATIARLRITTSARHPRARSDVFAGKRYMDVLFSGERDSYTWETTDLITSPSHGVEVELRPFFSSRTGIGWIFVEAQENHYSEVDAKTSFRGFACCYIGKRKTLSSNSLLLQAPLPEPQLVDMIKVVASASRPGEVTGPLTSITFGALGDGQKQYTIDPTKKYIIKGLWKKDSNIAVSLNFRPDGDSGNAHVTRVRSLDGSTPPQRTTLAAMEILESELLTLPDSSMGHFRATFDPRVTGLPRPFYAKAGAIDSVGPDATLAISSGGWTDLTTAPLSFELITDVADEIDIDSCFELYEERVKL